MDLNSASYWQNANIQPSEQSQGYPVSLIPTRTNIFFYPTTTRILGEQQTVQYNNSPLYSLPPSLSNPTVQQSYNQQLNSSNVPGSSSSDINQQLNYLIENPESNLNMISSNDEARRARDLIVKKLRLKNLKNKKRPIRKMISASDKIKPTEIGPKCQKKKCRDSTNLFCNEFTEETRQSIFNEFWTKMNSDQRHIYVASHAFRKPKENHKQINKNKFIYTLRNINGKPQQVCGDFFLKTLQIKENQVELWVKKFSIGGNGVSQAKLNMIKSLQPKKLNDNNKKHDGKSKDDQFISHYLDFVGLKNENQIAPTINCNNDDGISSFVIEQKILKKPKRRLTKRKSRRNHFDPNYPDKPVRTISNPSIWKCNIVKTLRLEGKSYKTRSKGQLIERKEKLLGPICKSSHCAISRFRHCQTISNWRREEIFNDFWHKWDWNQRKIWVASMVGREETRRKHFNKNTFTSRRQITMVYNLPNDNGIPVQVCCEMFVNTTAIGKSQIKRWVTKYTLGSKIEEKLTLDKDANAHGCDWLDALPKTKVIINGETIFYLDPQFKKLNDFYQVYCDLFHKEHGPNAVVMIKLLFKKMCNYKKIQLMPRNDLEDINCLCKNNKVNPVWSVEHNKKVEKASLQKSSDRKLAQSNEAIVLVLHLQPIKCVPILKTTENIYKSKLNCYNFTIYDLKTEFSHCYWFSEDQCGELNSNNSSKSIFTTIICDYIKKNCLARKIPIIIYSNGQLEQTRNLILSNALLNLAILNKIEIYQKFSVNGHCLVDDCFKVNNILDKYIYIKKKEIYLPSQLAKSSREIKRQPKLFNGIHLDYDFFLDYSKLETLRYISINPSLPSDLIDNLNENDICTIQYNINEKMLIKFNFDDEWIELEQNLSKDFKKFIEYPKLFNGMAEISKTKWDDLQDLKIFIPFDCQPFYDSIKYYED